MKKNSKFQNAQPNHSFYLFALKEGKRIKENYLDYSLLLLQVGNAITLPSPNKASTPPELPFTINLGKPTQDH